MLMQAVGDKNNFWACQKYYGGSAVIITQPEEMYNSETKSILLLIGGVRGRRKFLRVT